MNIALFGGGAWLQLFAMKPQGAAWRAWGSKTPRGSACWGRARAPPGRTTAIMVSRWVFTRRRMGAPAAASRRIGADPGPIFARYASQMASATGMPRNDTFGIFQNAAL